MNKLFASSLVLGLLAMSPAYAAGEGGGDFIYVENDTEDNMAGGLGNVTAEAFWGLAQAGIQTGSNAGSVDIDVTQGTDVYVINHTGKNTAIGGSNAGSVRIKQH